jgi:hypothetical protein
MRAYDIHMTQIVYLNLILVKKMSQEVEAEARAVKEVDFHHMEEVVEVEVEVEAEAMLEAEVEVEVKLEIDIVLEQAEVLVLVIC